MPSKSQVRRRTSVAIVALALIAGATCLATTIEEAPFIAENDAAMTKMMRGMDIQPSGDIDADFVAMMVPHHQAAIDMAVAQLKYGRNERLKRLAQEIIVTQQEEIAAMRLAVGQALPPSIVSPVQPQLTQPSGKVTARDSMHLHPAQ